ncbi:MAG TPA: AmmeMemoRadiSam system radical SAM enzyme [Anaeromyxobacter sp.]|nr:AmmeMemoRadiSam system radical SAM enzyme [Anaeromyxobacter sp.]
MLTRRELLRASARLLPLLAGGGLVAAPGGRSLARSRLQDLVAAAPRARFWTSVEQAGADCAACHAGAAPLPPHHHPPGLVRCGLCARACTILPGQAGGCHARFNAGGELRSLVYGRPLAIHRDPIEKKPFYHFLPGAVALSLGTAGCPLRCRFCQNWQISQARPEEEDVPWRAPAELAAAAAASHDPVIAFTYNEPTVQAEYLLEVASAARAEGVRSVLVSCGYASEAPLAEMCRALAAVKIDLKGYSPEFYREVCGADLSAVLRSIRQAARSGVHLELVNLVVPTLNDSPRMLDGLARWVAGELGPDVPLHFTRFHPDYLLQNLPPTPVATLERARELALAAGIRYAYVGNVPGHPGNHTYCPRCGKVVVARSSFFVTSLDIRDGRCRFCQQPIAGVWA